MNRLLALACLFALCGSPALVRGETPLPAKEKFQIYLLIGQSNMAGRGAVEEADKKPHPRVLKFTKENAWAPAIDPLHFDKPVAGVGLGSSFGRAMADADPGVTIGLIPCAVGGTPLSRWQKGGDLFQQAIKRAQAAQKDGVLKGILWHQGESDSGSEQTAATYAERLTGMIAAFREELAAPSTPFVAGELGEFLVNRKEKPGHFGLVNAQLALVAKQVPRCALVSAAELKHKGDGVHFDAPSLREFGRRYAQALQTLAAAK